jgi:hypothetical protein
MGKDMDNQRKTCRTDEQLHAILCETGDWSVTGLQGQILCMAASLERAIQRAAEYSASDAVVTGLTRLPAGDIVVPAAQIRSLRRHISEPEAA